MCGIQGEVTSEVKPVVAQGAQSVTVKSIGFRRTHLFEWGSKSPLKQIKYLLTFTFSILTSGSGVEAKRGRQLGGKWGTVCLKTRFPRPILLELNMQ